MIDENSLIDRINAVFSTCRVFGISTMTFNIARRLGSSIAVVSEQSPVVGFSSDEAGILFKFGEVPDQLILTVSGSTITATKGETFRETYQKSISDEDLKNLLENYK